MIRAVGIVVPANDEQDLLARCLAAIKATVAEATRLPAGPRVHTVIALDACTDGTPAIARAAGVHTVSLSARNVGQARAAGVRRILELEEGTAPEDIWLCTTDADSVVPPHWLTKQLTMAAGGAAAFAGTIRPDGWQDHQSRVAELWNSHYRSAAGHGHVHGANLGCNAAVYEAVGGFEPLSCGEDVELLRALSGYEVLRGADPAVVTSTRDRGRAAGGFADYLRDLERHAGGSR